MKFIRKDANEIQVQDRQREVFKAESIDDLAASIGRVGLIHAPVITESGRLVAGERRLRALKLLEGDFRYGGELFQYPASIPVHVVPYEDPKLLFEIELEENLRRENLTPMEQAKAIAKLHQVRKQQVPERTIKETAQEVATLQSKEYNDNDARLVAEALLVDEFSDDPEVQTAAKTSIRKAAKIARKKMELDFLGALTYQEKQTGKYFRVYGGDATMIMESMEPATYDILLFDPPYGVDANKFGEQAHGLGHQYSDSFDDAAKFMDGIMQNLQVLKENAHILMFCSPDLFNDWKMYYENHGLRVWPRPLIWSKGTGHLPVPERGPRYTYETILFAVRGNRRVASVTSDVFSVPAVRDKIHAAEKPVELLRQLLEFVAQPGDHILDPCCGSGPIFQAARDLELFVDGIEIEEKYVHVAKERANG